MNPAEIVKKVLGGHGPNLHDCACACGLPVQRIEHPNLPLPLFFDFDAHRTHVASEIVAALGLALPTITAGVELSNELAKLGVAEGDRQAVLEMGARVVAHGIDVATLNEMVMDLYRKRAEQERRGLVGPPLPPQAHVPAQERPKPANVGTGEGLEGAEVGA